MFECFGYDPVNLEHCVAFTRCVNALNGCVGEHCQQEALVHLVI